MLRLKLICHFYAGILTTFHGEPLITLLAEMKCPVSLLYLSVAVQAHSFKIYELLIPQTQLEDFSALEEMVSASSGGDARITAYAHIPEV